MHSITKISKPIFLTLPNGNHTAVTKIGSVILNDRLTVENVFYIPSFSFNLLSVPKIITQNEYLVEFTSSTCVFQDQLRAVMATGDLHGRLYILYGKKPDSAISCLTNSSGNVVKTTCNLDPGLWHNRLGHPSLSTLKRISQLSTIFPSDLIDNSVSEFAICPLTK